MGKEGGGVEYQARGGMSIADISMKKIRTSEL